MGKMLLLQTVLLYAKVHNHEDALQWNNYETLIFTWLFYPFQSPCLCPFFMTLPLTIFDSLTFLRIQEE